MQILQRQDPSRSTPLHRALKGAAGRALAIAVLVAHGVLLSGCAQQQHRATPSTGVTAGRSLERTVVSALDSEALYTIAGGLKPLSSGFWTVRIPQDDTELREVDAMRRALQSLDDGQLSWGVMAFAEPHEGARNYHAWVAHRSAVAAVVRRHGSVFAPHGISPASRPAELLAQVERLPRADRFRCYGLLFGYPEHAVDFFVAADAQREKQPDEVAPRRFLSIPTFGAAEGRFVYAVPPDHEPVAADESLRQAALRILDQYRSLRERYLTDPPRRALQLLSATKQLHARMSSFSSSRTDR